MPASERALKRSEREILKLDSSASAKRSNYIFFAFIFLMLLSVTFIPIGLLWDIISWPFGWPDFETIKWRLLVVCAILSLAISGKFAITEHNYIVARKGHHRLADEDLSKGLAIVEQLEVEEVVEIEEWEDEGAGFLLSLRDGRVLCLIGQDLYPYSVDADVELKAEVAGNVFPSDKIEFVYAPRSGIVLDTKGLGAYLKPRSRVRWQGKGPNSNPYNGPTPDRFNDGPLEEIIARAGFIEEAL